MIEEKNSKNVKLFDFDGVIKTLPFDCNRQQLNWSETTTKHQIIQIISHSTDIRPIQLLFKSPTYCKHLTQQWNKNHVEWLLTRSTSYKSPTDTKTQIFETLQFNHYENWFSLFSSIITIFFFPLPTHLPFTHTFLHLTFRRIKFDMMMKK